MNTAKKMKHFTWLFLIVILLGSGRVFADPIISEFMAINDATLSDEDGDFSDWIEIFNISNQSVHLDGWFLTDDETRLERWRFPDVMIEAGGYLIVFASNKNRINPGNELHANFRLSGQGEYLALVKPDGITVASEYEPEFPQQYPDISYGIDSNNFVYFLNPTPGASNHQGTFGFLKDPVFSHQRGYYNAPFNLVLSSDDTGINIRYTMDGSEPTESHGALYHTPLSISGTTIVRAVVVKGGYVSSNVITQTFIFSEAVISQPGHPAGYPDLWGPYFTGSIPADYEMDHNVTEDPQYSNQLEDALLSIPSLALTMDISDWFNYKTGIYCNPNKEGIAWERKVSVEWIPHNGEQNFALNAGIRIQGGSSTWDWSTPKLSMRLLFKSDYGPSKLEQKLFPDSPIQSINTLILDARYNMTWTHSQDEAQRTRAQYIRDQFMSDLQNAMGWLSPHGLYAHVYINGLYWGIYCIHERPDDEFLAEYLGGNPADYDVIRHNTENVVSGSNIDFLEMFNIARQGLSNEGRYYQIGQYLDIPEFIDYMILNFYAGNEDWDETNWYAGRNRMNGSGFRYYSWDAEKIFNVEYFDNTTEYTEYGPTDLHTRLMTNPEYKILFADHIHKHLFNDGILTPDQVLDYYMTRIEEVDPAVILESARWGDHYEEITNITYFRNIHWINELNRLRNQIIPNRTDFVMGQFRAMKFYPDVDAPEFNQHGGHVVPGFDLTIQSDSDIIYYTLGGSDPRKKGGDIADAALFYNGSISITQSVTVKARVIADSVWSALTEATFIVGTVDPASSFNCVVTEINYNPSVPTPTEVTAGVIDNDEFEFIEFLNTGDHIVDMTGVYIGSGVAYSFIGDGSGYIDPGERLVIVKDLSAFQIRYGPNIPLAGPYIGNLNNAGETIVIFAADGDTLITITYDNANGWPGRADGFGSTLEVIDINGDLNDGDNWRASCDYLGSPGKAGSPLRRSVVVNEVLCHTDLPLMDAIELYNILNEPVEVGGWYLSDSHTYKKFQIPPGTVIPAGGYLVFDENDFNSDTSETGFALSSANGDDVWLLEADAGDHLIRFIDHVEFGAAANGESFGRWPNGSGDLYPMENRTLGMDNGNSKPRLGPIVICEIMYHPPDNNTDLEYVAIYNSSCKTEMLTHWRLSNAIDFDFPSDAQLHPGEIMIVVPFNPETEPGKLSLFEQFYHVPHYYSIVGGWTGLLSNGGERLDLTRPDEPPTLQPNYYPQLLEDRVRYNDSYPWPIEPDGGGSVLKRLNHYVFSDTSANWYAWDKPLVLNPEMAYGQAVDQWSVDSISVVGHLFIPDGQILNIQPGVYVNFTGHYMLNVQGQLAAVGSRNDSITFTVRDTIGFSDMDNGNGGWLGIRFNSTSSHNDHSKLAYCRLTHGKAVGEHPYNMGGAICCIHTSNVIISNCLITHNMAEQGGGIACLNGSGPKIINNLIVNNSTFYPISSSSTFGGGMVLDENASPQVIGNLIRQNQADFGGGIACLNGSMPSLINNTVNDNRAVMWGGGLACIQSDANLKNSILYDNAALQGAQVYCNQSAPDFLYNNIQGGLPGFYITGGGQFSGTYENNIDLDPGFDESAWGYGLKILSPCVDTANPDTLGLNLPLQDMIGNQRILDGNGDEIKIVDMGAFEFVFNNEAPLSFDLTLPPNDAILNTLAVVFQWQTSIDPDEDPVQYTFHLTGTQCDTIIRNIPDTTITFIGDQSFIGGETYSWYVESSDGIVNTTSSSTFQFHIYDTGIDDDNQIPSHFALRQNYPNPFNPMTTIRYQLPVKTQVTLNIYSVTGRRVETLVNSIQDPGFYQVVWDASQYGAGLYVFHMKAGAYSKMYKCVLIK